MRPAQLFALGFAIIILAGALLLCLPVSNRDGHSIPFINALFTSCSATCVTGLVVYDTWSQFTAFGQVVIICLIQIGGLGFMTFAILISMAAGKRIGLRERINFSEAVGAGRLGGVVKLARRTIFGTLIIEGLGAIILAIRFSADFPAGTAIWYGVFHSISAFCNAGFDLMGVLKPGSSLMLYVGDPTVNFTIMALIVLGGLGFVVWDDAVTNKFRFKRLNLHSKLVLTYTAGAIIISALLFLVTERDGVFRGMNAGTRVLASLFCAVTPRTAGFNTVDVGAMSQGGTLLTTLLMIIGAGSGSTGGGVKISTFAVMVLSVIAYTRGHRDVNVMQRRIDQDVCHRAFCSVLLYLGVALLSGLVICATQPLPLTNVLFECFSAIGTVGLTTGITSKLWLLPKAIIILLMYSGRVGSLTLFMAISLFKNDSTRFPEEQVIIG
jgi:trk system potassium uptake protein TrkH